MTLRSKHLLSSLVLAFSLAGSVHAQVTTTSAVTLSPDGQAALALAEEIYPTMFVQGSALQQASGYTYRFYAATGIYVGFKDGSVHVMGGSFGNVPKTLGTIAAVTSLLQTTKAQIEAKQAHSGDLALANQAGRPETAPLFVAAGTGTLGLWTEVNDLKARLFDGDGKAIGSNIIVVPTETSRGGITNHATDIVTLADGSGFLITLNSAGNISGPGTSYRFLQLDTSGNPVGLPKEIVRDTSLQANSVRVEQLTDGGFVYVWDQAPFIPNVGGDFQIGARIYNADGQPRTDRLTLINPTGNVNLGDLQATKDGGFVVAYRDQTTVSAGDIVMQYFNADGTTKGATIKGIDAGTPAAFAALSNGNYAIAEVSTVGLGGTGSSSKVSVHIVSAQGLPAVSQVSVDTIAPMSPFGGDGHSSPKILPLADGGFILAYVRSRRGGTGNVDTGTKEDIFARRIDAKGALVGSEVAVNLELTGLQSLTTAALLKDGRVVFGWNNVGSPVIENDVRFSIIRFK